MVNYGNSFPIKKKNKAMKKIYINPDLKIVKIQTSKMFATSEYINVGDNVTTASGAESRRGGSIWDDEDEEY